jgi:hypothetical protein
MAYPTYDPSQRQRELRRRLMLPARIRSDGAWSDARILNISSHGLMIQASRGTAPGSTVELTRGAHVILAKVKWREGTRAGLQVHYRLPVEDILTVSQVPGLQLTATETLKRPVTAERHERSRGRARNIEFAGVAVIAGALSIAAYVLLQHAFAEPMAKIEAALIG